jgi:hypothetical protein
VEPRIRRFFTALHEGWTGSALPEAGTGPASAEHFDTFERLARDWSVSPLEAGLRLLSKREGNGPPIRDSTHELGPLDLACDHPALRGRGLEPNLCRDREIGLVSEANNPHAGWLAVTVFDILGRRVGWTYRRLEADQEPARPSRGGRPPARWSISPSFPRGRHLYNLDRAWPSLVSTETAIVVEGPFDALHLHRSGWPNTVALLGNRLTGWHVDLLLTVGVSAIVLLLDNDHGGRQGRHWALKTDARLSQFRVIDLSSALPPGQDPDDLTREALPAVLGPYKPA